MTAAATTAKRGAAGLTARDVMRTKVVTARADMTVHELAQLLTEHHISGAPVVARDGRLVGVVSQTDLVRHELEPAEVPAYHREPEQAMPAGFHSEAPDYTRVQDVMTPTVITGEEDMPLRDLARLMQRRHVHRVIITKNGLLRGIVTSMDLLKVLVVILERKGGAAC